VPKLANMSRDRKIPRSAGGEPANSLLVKRSATGYWTVQRGSVQLAFAMTREAAEHERETLQRLSRCSSRRAGSRSGSRA
jgi:hypothetical protein